MDASETGQVSGGLLGFFMALSNWILTSICAMVKVGRYIFSGDGHPTSHLS